MALLLWLSAVAQAQPTGAQPTAAQPIAAQPYAASVKHYGPEQGLSHREVNAIFQDPQGFMWFGTKLGLNRFDGQKFTTYTKERNGLDFDDIQSIAQDADGMLWLMGPYGQSRITLFNPLTNKAISFEEKFRKQRPPGLFDVPQRLLSSANGTIFFTDYQPARLISYHPASGLRNVSLPQFKKLAAFQVTARNTVWAIADDKFLLELTLDGRIVRQFSHAQASIGICFGQRNAGIEFFYFYTGPAKRAPDAFYSVDESGQRREWPLSLLQSLNKFIFPVCYAFDRTSLIWDGMSLRDSTNRTVLTIAPQTAGAPITNRSFLRDRNGLFWLGTSFGVYQVKLAENYFHRLFNPETSTGASIAPIRGITVLGDQVFANLENQGLYTAHRRSGLPKKLSIPKIVGTDGAAFVFAYGLTQDELSDLYVGINHRFVRYTPATGASSTVDSPKGYNMWAFRSFGPEQWLVGCQKGLLLLKTSQERLLPYTQYNQFTELAQAHILHIAPDRQGQFWICATTGLYTVDPQKGITARYWSGGKDRFYLPAESYQHFYQDPQGIYWLATANAGLIRWDRRQNQHRKFRRSEGLSNDNIYAVYADGRGHLWMSSDYGLMQFDPTRFTTRSYFVEDGITHNEFNRIAHYQDKNGRLYFGGLNGITAFDPRDFQTEKPATGLPLRITSFRQYDNSVDKLVDKTDEVVRTNTITIQPDDRSSVLDFALLNYTNAEKNVYAYQFAGIDQEWTYQTEPTLRLSNLPYGNQQLLIKAQAANGQWSGNTLAINLLVVRPVYMRIWFMIGMALLVGAGIWAWLRWRVWQHQNEQVRLQREIHQATARIEGDKEIIAAQAKDLLKLNETKSRFFANISHEFRTPLTVILGMAAELTSKPNAPFQAVEQAARLIERNGSNLLRLINQILDLSKLEAGEMRLHLVRGDLVSFIRYVGESFQSMAEEKNIQLHFRFGADRIDADFDRDKLQDITANLLANALKFTPAGGHVSCRVDLLESWQPLSLGEYYEELTPTAHLNFPWIQIGVSDTGPGIDPTSLSKIFDRFYRTEQHSTSQAGGTGIGLSLVRELVLLMQGGLAVRNRPLQGAEFVISLPLTRQAQPDGAAPAPTLNSPEPGDWREWAGETSPDKPVVLLVEDNPDVTTYIRTCLQADYQVIRAINGQLGIDLALENVPDLVLSDVMMPLKDGFELCHTLKTDERTSHIPIVLLTARAAVSDRITGLRRGADAYLVKPFLGEELLVVLSNLLQTRRLLQIHYSHLALGTGMTEPAPANSDQTLEDQFLVKLRTTVETNLDNTNLSIDDICRLMGMSRSPLNQKLTSLTGMSINKYLRSLRLRKAQEMLATSGLNISDVAYAVGFEDPKYFSRVFSEEFGMSPVNYRLSVKGRR
ncbi:MAG TPA: two-component regulator propeller domain-containing protein [Spirosoma sp.]|nr:two-component regulator propeller domain-containing protein [Spirosoma sp.]